MKVYLTEQIGRGRRLGVENREPTQEKNGVIDVVGQEVLCVFGVYGGDEVVFPGETATGWGPTFTLVSS